MGTLASVALYEYRVNALPDEEENEGENGRNRKIKKLHEFFYGSATHDNFSSSAEGKHEYSQGDRKKGACFHIFIRDPGVSASDAL